MNNPAACLISVVQYNSHLFFLFCWVLMFPFFVISLDFELFWGVRDVKALSEYGPNILGVRQAIPAMLKLFYGYDVHATWATVGMLLFDNKKDLINSLPKITPNYQNAELDAYNHIRYIGNTEREDPYHYGLSLAEMIVDTSGMEIASHTFSHYYCLEKGQNADLWKADIEASVNATRRLGVTPVSLVFPRNQCNMQYLSICKQMGFRTFRGNESSWMYKASSYDRQQQHICRVMRGLDSYINISGSNGFIPSNVQGLINIPSSRFLRPFSYRLRHLEPMRIERVKSAMAHAAKQSLGFHLWWHPHNFGINLKENLTTLETILKHFSTLREKYSVRPLTMREVAEQCFDRQEM